MRIADEFVARLERFAAGLPAVRALHLPHASARGSRDGEFCALELEDGSIGLSYVLLGDTLERLLAAQPGGRLEGMAAIELARWATSTDAVSRMLGFAGINAISQHLFTRAGYEPPDAADSTGGLEIGPGRRIGMIGLFPGLARRIVAGGAELIVVERRAELAGVAPEGYRVTLDAGELGTCEQILSTTTLLLNDTLDEMLARCRGARRIALVGPGGGCLPDPLFERGVTLLGGTRVVDRDGFVEAMRDDGAWGPFARKYAIERAHWRPLFASA